MAHFFGGVGNVTRVGHKSTGMTAFARGWNIGGEVETRYDKSGDQDIVSFSLGGGSNGAKPVTLMEFAMNMDGKPFLRFISEDMREMLSRHLAIMEDITRKENA